MRSLKFTPKTTPIENRQESLLIGLRNDLNFKVESYSCITCGNMMQKEVKVGKKGQVVIPKAMRTALKIEPGSKVLFTFDDNKLILTKVP